MTTLVVGASGATGRQLVEQLLSKAQNVKVIVRSAQQLPDSWKNKSEITIIEANISDLKEAAMITYVRECRAVVSCLGHNMTWKGIYGEPRKLVTDAVVALCNAIKKTNTENTPLKFILMNTAGNQNRDLNESSSIGQKLVIGLIRLLLPPHVDNEKAADYLRTAIGQKDPAIEWVAVRPDSLTNETTVTPYEVFPSPIRNPIFKAGTTSRINVAHFMADLITNNALWNKWKGQMPVIYNKGLQKNDQQ